MNENTAERLLTGADFDIESLARDSRGDLWIGDEFDEGDRLAATLWVGRDVRDKVGAVVRAVSLAGPEGTTVLLAAETRLLAPAAGAVPVTLGVRRPVVSGAPS